MSVYDDMRGLLAGLVTSDETAERLDRMVETAEVGHDEAVLQCERLEMMVVRLEAERGAALECHVELPVGADGLPIRVGDVVDVVITPPLSGVTVTQLNLREGWAVYVDIPGRGAHGFSPDLIAHADASFGPRLRRLLRERGMGQSDLARSIDLSEATVSRWCTHERTPRYAQLVAVREALGCSWDELMGE